MARDRSKPWGPPPDDDPEPTDRPSGAWDDEATASSERRAPRRGSRRNDDETNVGGSLLPGDDFGLAAVFEQALAPAFVSEPVDEAERTEPAMAPPPARPPNVATGHRPPEPAPAPAPKPPPAPSPEPETLRPPQAQRPRPSLSLPPEEEGLGPVEEFTISGLMPDELKAMADAAREAVTRADGGPPPLAPPAAPPAPVRKVHADPPRTSRHDPDPLITGVLTPAGGAPPGQRPGDEEDVEDAETIAMNLLDHPDMIDLRESVEHGGRDYHTFGAGLQRLDQLPEVSKKKKEPPSGGGILELLDGAPEPASPTGAHPAPSEADRPRRIATNRAGSMGRSGRAPTPVPAKQRAVAPNPKGATPRPAPARADRPDRGAGAGGSIPPRESLRRSGGRGGRPQPSTPAPPTRPQTSGRAMDEEARIRAALASVSDDEHTSWVNLNEPEPSESPPARAPGNRPRAERPEAVLPGVTPIGMSPREAPPPPPKGDPGGLTMDLTEVPSGGEPTRPVEHLGDEATVTNTRTSLGEEVTVPAGPPAPSDDATVPVKVPNTRAKGRIGSTPPAAQAPGAKPPQAKAPPAKPPPAKAPPPKKPGGKKPPSAKKGGPSKKPPVDIAPLGDDSSDSYRDGALPWIASMFAVMVIGSGIILFLIMLLYLI